MSTAVTSPTALSAAYSRFSHTSSRYLYFNKYFSLENTSSIGFKSGEYTGRKTSSMSRSLPGSFAALFPLRHDLWPDCLPRQCRRLQELVVALLDPLFAKPRQRIAKTGQSSTLLLRCFHISLHQTQPESSTLGRH